MFGADLNADERKALDIEIRRECAKAVDQMERQVDILMLWQLHVQEGWGKKRLEKFYVEFAKIYDELRRYYQPIEERDPDEAKQSDDNIWIMKRQLSEIGVDVDDLFKTRMEREV